MKQLEKFLNVGQILTREELRNVKGGVEASPGSPCSYTYMGSGGNWITETGTCMVAISQSGPYAGTSNITYTPYCNTPSHQSPTPLSSNGGVSRCGAPESV